MTADAVRVYTLNNAREIATACLNNLPSHIRASFDWSDVWVETFALVTGASRDSIYLFATMQSVNLSNELAPLYSPVMSGQWVRDASLLVMQVDLAEWGKIVFTFQPTNSKQVFLTVRIDRGLKSVNNSQQR